MTAREIVAVGASRGGLAALSLLLGALGSAFPLPVVIVYHRAQTLSRVTSSLGALVPMPVEEAVDKAPVRPGLVSVAPAGYHLLVERGWLALSTDPAVNHARPSVDVLFESLADSYGNRAVGIVLSGGGHDGAAGLARLASFGGLALVQSPEEALASEMPRAALAATPGARSLTARQIAACLSRQLGAVS